MKKFYGDAAEWSMSLLEAVCQQLPPLCTGDTPVAPHLTMHAGDLPETCCVGMMIRVGGSELCELNCVN
jgi:hypothetical protein